MIVTEAPCLLSIFNKRDVSILPKTAKQFGNTPGISRRWILCTDPANVRPEWTVRPCFQFWPPQRHGAVLWILAHIIYYWL